MAYLAAAGRLGWQPPACTNFLSSSCYSIGLSLVHAITGAEITAAAGAALLLSRWLAVRYARLAPARRGLALAAGMVLAMSAVVIGIAGWIPALPVRLLGPPGPSFRVSAAALIECLAAAVSLADSRPRRYVS